LKSSTANNTENSAPGWPAGLPRKGNSIRGAYVISDTCFSRGRGHEEVVAAALKGGARVIQLREKRLSFREAYPVALRLRDMTKREGAVFIVNDSVELALAVDADGVHLGQEDMPQGVARRLLGKDRIIGISTHSLGEALAAQEGGADYIGFGPMYATSTKDAGKAKGPEALRSLRASIKIPIVAIGGINEGNAGELISAGADALAVISAVTMADDIEEAVRRLSLAFNGR
jgi:thiamine-phosphate pyrophosphorylase